MAEKLGLLFWGGPRYVTIPVHSALTYNDWGLHSTNEGACSSFQRCVTASEIELNENTRLA